MAAITRRQFGSGALAAGAAMQLEPAASALSPITPGAANEAFEHFFERYWAYMYADGVYGSAEAAGRPLAWGEAYAELIDAHYDLHREATADTAAARKLIDACNRIVPPTCQQALAFWTPLEGLSPRFADLQPRVFATRACHARARYEFWSAYPSGHVLNETQSDHFVAQADAMAEASEAWFAIRQTLRLMVARTDADRDLSRRIVQSFTTGDVLDVPYLKRAVREWKPYAGEIPELRRCAFDCADCEGLLGPRRGEMIG